ncbi:MAG: hypothetical protein D6722_14760 [Bacteroidetes bacterium]|nr:MAG: hypothetical protein D6722_14760 [Bacteroidota bacterium]
MKRFFWLCMVFWVGVSLQPARAQLRIEVDNTRPRLDQQGQPVDAHDGRVIRFGAYFYWYGTRYGRTNGFTPANRYQVYRSRDLQDWELMGPLLPEAPAGVYYRPHVVYHAGRRQYVLWYNWYPKLWEGQFGVAVSDRPEGPFRIVHDDVQVAHSDIGVGDFGLFVDEDQTAYLTYNTIAGHQVSVEKLAPDYLSSTLENGGFMAKQCEAGSMFRRGEFYYLLTDYTCCFCNQGSGARVYRSRTPLRGYTLLNNINRRPGPSLPRLADGEAWTSDFEPLARQDSIYPPLRLVLDQPTALAGLTAYVFTANRPGPCGEVENPQVHEPFRVPQFSFFSQENGSWEPLPAELSSVDSLGMICRVTYRFPQAQVLRALNIQPESDAPEGIIRLTEFAPQSRGVRPSFRVFRDAGLNGPVIIPAQQTHIMQIETSGGPEFIWMGDMWGSAPDHIKGHDWQYWGAPLRFDAAGHIEPMRFTPAWSFLITD